MPSFAEVLPLIESDIKNASAHFRPNGSDGTSVRAISGRIDPLTYQRNLLEATRLINDVVSGRKSALYLQEVMTTDDFPIYMGDVIDRTLLAAYEEWPMSWEAYAKRVTVRDFRDAKVFPPAYGADGPLDIVPEADQFPDARIYEQSPILWHVNKYGRRVPFSMESIINDDLGQLQDIPKRLARATRRTEHMLVANSFVDANGPHASFYTVGNKNIINTTNGAPASVGNNPVLTIAALQAAYTVLSKMTDETGEPIMREMVTLVVPPALEITARNIIEAITINATSVYSGGNPNNTDSSPDAGHNELVINNWMRNRLKLVVDPYIPMIAKSANGDTSWFLFADPNVSREAIRIGFLVGHEKPEIWMKSPNAIRVGGGPAPVMLGDFDTASIEYRIMHITGVTRVDPKATVASNGSGS